MPYSITGPGYHLDMGRDEFKCPKCTCRHSGADWDDKFHRSKKGFIYIKCKGCKTNIGVTVDMMGDVQIWLKEDEKKCPETGLMVAPAPWYREGQPPPPTQDHQIVKE